MAKVRAPAADAAPAAATGACVPTTTTTHGVGVRAYGKRIRACGKRIRATGKRIRACAHRRQRRRRPPQRLHRARATGTASRRPRAACCRRRGAAANPTLVSRRCAARPTQNTNTNTKYTCDTGQTLNKLLEQWVHLTNHTAGHSRPGTTVLKARENIGNMGARSVCVDAARATHPPMDAMSSSSEKDALTPLAMSSSPHLPSEPCTARPRQAAATCHAQRIQLYLVFGILCGLRGHACDTRRTPAGAPSARGRAHSHSLAKAKGHRARTRRARHMNVQGAHAPGAPYERTRDATS